MKNLKGYLAAIFCVLVWGAMFVNTSGLLEDFSSLEILLLRFVLAWIMLVALTRKKLVKKKVGDIYRIGDRPFAIVDSKTQRTELSYEILSHQ